MLCELCVQMTNTAQDVAIMDCGQLGTFLKTFLKFSDEAIQKFKGNYNLTFTLHSDGKTVRNHLTHF